MWRTASRLYMCKSVYVMYYTKIKIRKAGDDVIWYGTGDWLHGKQTLQLCWRFLTPRNSITYAAVLNTKFGQFLKPLLFATRRGNIIRAGLTYLGRACTVLVGSPHFFHRTIWWPFFSRRRAFQYTLATPQLTNFSIFTFAWWWGLRCVGVSCARAHCAHWIIRPCSGRQKYYAGCPTEIHATPM